MADTDTDDDTGKKTGEAPTGDDDAPPLTPPPEKRRHTGRMVFALLFVILVLFAAGTVTVMIEPTLRARALALLGPARDSGRDAATTRRLDQLSSRVDRLADGLAALGAGLPAHTARLDGIDAKLAEFGAQLGKARLSAAPPDMPDIRARADRLAARVRTLETRIETLAAASPPSGGVGSEALALLALGGALDAGRPFASLVPPARRALRAAGAEGAARALDRLAARASKGVPTTQTLAARARALATLVGRAATPRPLGRDKDGEAAPRPGGGVWDKIMARLRGLITIRRVGVGEDVRSSSPVSTRVSTRASTRAPAPGARLRLLALDAAHKIDRGDFGAALAGLEAFDPSRLDAKVRAQLSALIEDMRARARADHLAAALTPVVIRPVLPNPGP